MKKALITGGTGQDGAYLARHLLKRGYAVTVSTRRRNPGNEVNLSALGIAAQVAFVELDPCCRDHVSDCVAEGGFTEIYHLSGQSSVGFSFEDPAGTAESITQSTQNVLETVRRESPDTRVFIAGSGEMYGDTGGEPVHEGMLPDPVNPYACAKAAAYFMTRSYRTCFGIHACTGILFNHESPLRPDRYVTRKIVKTACRIAKGQEKELVLGNIGVARDWGWAPEFVEAMHVMLQQEVAADYVIATGQVQKLSDFVSDVFSALGLDWRKHTKTGSSNLRPTDVPVLYGRPSAIARDLGWKARTLAPDVARKMVRFEMQENGEG